MPSVVSLQRQFLSRGRFLMSRKSRRNISKNARAERISALRLPCSTLSLSSLGLSSLALGSMAFASGVHAQDASPAKAANANAKKSKTAPTAQQAKSLRSKVTRLASSGTLPANGAGLVAQNTPAAAAADPAQAPQTTGLPTSQSANTLQEIVVTGIRGSLERGLQIKRESIGVVDAMSAEDIGQFPDSDIGEAV